MATGYDVYVYPLFTVIVRFHVLGIVEGPKDKAVQRSIVRSIVQRLYGGH